MPTARKLLAVLAVAAVPAAAFAAKPAPSTVSIAVAPATIAFGKAATVSGTTAPNTLVTLRADGAPFGSSFAQVATATSDAAGAYAFTVRPDVITRYRVTAKTKPAAQSAIATLSVRWKVTRVVSTLRPKRGARVRFTGRVAPADTGGRAELQRRTATGFQTIKTAALTASGTASAYSLRVRVRRRGTYRVRVEADGAHLAANSRRVKLRVR